MAFPFPRILLTALILLAPLMDAGAEPRTFTSADGGKLEGSILQADEKTVTIERKADKRKFTIPLTGLSAGDQEFIREWRQSSENVRVTVTATKRRSARERKDEASAGTTSIAASRATAEKWYWEIKVTNQRKDPVDSLYLHYSQYVGVQDRNYPAKALARQSNGNLVIPALPAFGSVTVRTEDIDTFSMNAVSSTENATTIRRTSEKWKEALNGLNLEVYRKHSLVAGLATGSNASAGLQPEAREREAWRESEIAKQLPAPTPPAKS